jgi:hypothetical protein
MEGVNIKALIIITSSTLLPAGETLKKRPSDMLRSVVSHLANN